MGTRLLEGIIVILLNGILYFLYLGVPEGFSFRHKAYFPYESTEEAPCIATFTCLHAAFSSIEFALRIIKHFGHYRLTQLLEKSELLPFALLFFFIQNWKLKHIIKIIQMAIPVLNIGIIVILSKGILNHVFHVYNILH
ncbi:hypothetical protein ACJX0J_012687 [Zea mays]